MTTKKNQVVNLPERKDKKGYVDFEELYKMMFGNEDVVTKSFKGVAIKYRVRGSKLFRELTPRFN
jgi:hypothetical protein